MRSALASGLRAQALQHVGDFELGVEAGGAGPLDHARRQIDADEMIDLLAKAAAASPVPQPRSIARLKKAGLRAAARTDSTALNNSAGPR